MVLFEFNVYVYYLQYINNRMSSIKYSNIKITYSFYNIFYRIDIYIVHCKKEENIEG